MEYKSTTNNMQATTIKLKSRPVGLPNANDFEITPTTLPPLRPGEVLLETKYVSVDPYLRGKMSGTKIPRFEIGSPINSKIIAKVAASNSPDFTEGDYVSHYLDWSTYQIANGAGLENVDPAQAALTAYLGVLGVTGLSAYFALTDIGQPKAGETLVVSGAAGAVGSIAGQIGKLMGCRVIGIVGTDEKMDLIKSKFGFDEAINYRTCGDIKAAIARACPEGVDIYFDNVGGPIADRVIENINTYGRVIACGAISNYNDVDREKSFSLLPMVVYKFLRIQGFLIADYRPRFPEGIQKLQTWLSEGKLTYSETIIKGFDKLPDAFIGLFSGQNEGKMIVEV
jgi:NADPH-dependent curcumin reductase CurA